MLLSELLLLWSLIVEQRFLMLSGEPPSYYLAYFFYLILLFNEDSENLMIELCKDFYEEVISLYEMDSFSLSSLLRVFWDYILLLLETLGYAILASYFSASSRLN